MRPHYTMDKRVMGVRTNAQGQFTLSLRPGRYFLQPLGPTIVPVSTPLIVLKAREQLKVELSVTGGV